jgi:hypothetical protein
MSRYGTRVTDVVEGDYFLGSAFADRYVDIEGASGVDGARAVISQGSGKLNQVFHIKPLGGGEYSIASKSSGKMLDVFAASTQDGAPVIQFVANGGANQRWSLYRNDAGYMYIVSVPGEGQAKVLDVTRASSRSGTRLELWSANGGVQQQFRLMQKVDLSGVRTVASRFADGNRLDVEGISMQSGAGVDIWTPSLNGNQRFEFVDRGNGLYAIRARHSGKLVDIRDGFAGDGGAVIQNASTESLSQLWYVQADAKGQFAIFSGLSNKALDVKAMSKSPGTQVITYRYVAQNNQKWDITTE